VGRGRHFRPQLKETDIFAQTGTAVERDRIFAALRRRNRVVAVLRIAVPAFGAVLFGGLVLQLFLVNLGDRFGFSGIAVDRGQLVVDTPSYASVGADGSSYRVEAASARSALGRTNVIELSGAVLTVTRPDGVVLSARAEAAELETGGQTVTVAGVTRLADSAGMHGSVAGLRADFAAEAVTGSGPVDITFPHGAWLTAEAMSYDAASATWRFARATLMLADTPGAGAEP